MLWKWRSHRKAEAEYQEAHRDYHDRLARHERSAQAWRRLRMATARLLEVGV